MNASHHARRAIDDRYIPPVAGIDLEQALNYIDMDVVGEQFVYEHYTSRRLFYVRGSRPILEDVAQQTTHDAAGQFAIAECLAKWVASHVQWAGYHEKHKGVRLREDQCPSEEHLINYGYGWCNEQARLYCLLTQIAGLPSRIVFASNKARHYGHCISEVLIDEGWMAVDQSLGFCFNMAHVPVRASRIIHDAQVRSYFTPIYTTLCSKVLNELGPIAKRDFAMSATDDPLDGFTNLGFCNYFAH